MYRFLDQKKYARAPPDTPPAFTMLYCLGLKDRSYGTGSRLVRLVADVLNKSP